MVSFGEYPRGPSAPFYHEGTSHSRKEPPMPPAMIPDPFGRLSDDFMAALHARYEGSVIPLPLGTSKQDSARRYSAICDVLTQLLYPEDFDTSPMDPRRHVSDAARLLAQVILDAAGIQPR